MKFIKIPEQSQTIVTPEQNWNVASVVFDYVQQKGTLTLFNGVLKDFSMVNMDNILIKEIPFIDTITDKILSTVAQSVDATSEVVTAPIDAQI